MGSIAPARPSYLQAAEEAARWIRSTARPTEHGLVWLPDPDQPDLKATITSPATLYSGNAGIVLFLLELANATGSPAYLDDAKQGGDQIAATWREIEQFQGFLTLENALLDFQFGLSGTGWLLGQLWLAIGETRYRDASHDIFQYIASKAKPAGSGVAWIGSPTVGLGDGLIILTLLWAAETLDDPLFRELAIKGGQRFLETPEPDGLGGIRWRNPFLSQFGAPEGAYAPNFELGTAGTAFVLARLYQETNEQAFLDAAIAGVEHLKSIATLEDDAALIYYRSPDFTDLYYLGYCHGPVGTSRPFYLLHEITGDDRYLEWVERLARGVIRSGVPEMQTPGLWNVVCQCCGTAGIADFFTGLALVTNNEEYLTFAERVAAVTLSRESDFDGQGPRWYQAWTRTRPDAVNAETGYMIGAAGVGASFLHLALAQDGRYQALLFPDNPYPRSQPA